MKENGLKWVRKTANKYSYKHGDVCDVRYKNGDVCGVRYKHGDVCGDVISMVMCVVYVTWGCV